MWFMDTFDWYWPSGWYWAGLLLAAVLVFYRRKVKDATGAVVQDADGKAVKGPRRFNGLGLALLAFLAYEYFELYARLGWWQVVFWVIFILGLIIAIFRAARSDRSYSRWGKSYKPGESRNIFVVLAVLMSLALPLALLLAGYIADQDGKLGSGSSSTGTPTPGATSSQTSTPSGTSTTQAPATAKPATPVCNSTVPTVTVGDKATQDARSAAKASCEAAKASAAEAQKWANQDHDADSKAEDAKGEAESAEHFYNDALQATNAADAKAAANSAAKAAANAKQNATDAMKIANGTYVPPASADDDTTVPPPSGDKGEGANTEEASKLFPSKVSSPIWPDSVDSALKDRTEAGVVARIRSNGVVAAWTARTINVWVKKDAAALAQSYPFFGSFTSDAKTNAWVANCRSGEFNYSDCQDTVDKIADFVQNQPSYLGLVRASTSYNVHRAAFGFANTLSTNPVQEKAGWFLAFGVKTKTGTVCFGFNVGTASSGVNGGDMRPAVMKKCVKHSVVHVVPQGKGAGSGKATHVVHHTTTKVVHHTTKVVHQGKGAGHETTKTTVKKPRPPHTNPPQRCKPTHPEEHTGGPYHWSYKLCKWFKDWKNVSTDVKKDGGKAGAKQPVGDNHTSGVDTGPSTTVPEPTPLPTHTGSDTPAANGSGNDTGGGTGTSPGGGTPTGDPDPTTGGSGNGSDPGSP